LGLRHNLVDLRHERIAELDLASLHVVGQLGVSLGPLLRLLDVRRGDIEGLRRLDRRPSIRLRDIFVSKFKVRALALFGLRRVPLPGPDGDHGPLACGQMAKVKVVREYERDGVVSFAEQVQTFQARLDACDLAREYTIATVED